MAKSHNPPTLPWQQLVILSICRLADPIALSSVFPYLPEMIESFGVPQDEVSKWAGITSAVFSLSQACTGVAWGRASDRFGRKPVILVGMMCIMSTSLLWGFSKSLPLALLARCLSGASNGNVGLMRTAVAELVPERELQPRAFSIMPLVWTIGSILGPGFGGALADPAHKYPTVFGMSKFFRHYPFALPNLAAAGFFLVGLTVGFLFLRETLETRRRTPDFGRKLGQLLLKPCTQRTKAGLPHDEEQSASLLKHSRVSSTSSSVPETDVGTKAKHVNHVIAKPPSYREVFSYQSNMNLLVYTLLALHSIAYDQVLPVFMHFPRQTDRSSNPNVRLPFRFTGGFGIESDRIGLLFMAYGLVGVFIQIFAFPILARRWGVLNCLKIVSLMFPIAYLITPFTALLPSPLAQQLGIFTVMVFKCCASIFAFPCTTILLTNSATSLRILGTLNGMAVSISALGRAAGPAIVGWTFTLGVDAGYAIIPFWTLAAFGITAAVPVWWLVEMEGFGGIEDGDGEEEDEPNQPLPYAGQAVDRSSAISMKNHTEDENVAEEDFAGEDDGLLYPHRLSHTICRNSVDVPLFTTRRMSSPLGMRDSVGPGGSSRLSNGLGQSNSGFGAGGCSYS